MKVLQVGKFYPILGGVEKVMLTLTQGISSMNIHCDMLCANLDFKSLEITINEKSKLYCVRTLLKLYKTTISPGMIFKLRKICNNYDIIHIHHPDPMASLALFLSGYKGRIILHWHSDILSQKMMLKLYSPLQKWIIKRADLIIGTTPVYVKESLALKSFQNKIEVLPIGILDIVTIQDDISVVKKQYPNKKIIFSLGRLVPYKGFEYLIQSAEFLPDDYIILIGGTGDLKDSLTRLITDKGLEHKVKLLGFISDSSLPAYFGACDIFCLSSIAKTEAFAIVQIEAMCCSKPIVSTKIDGSGVSWVNEDQISGINVPPKDSKALAVAIKKILSDDEVYLKYSLNARKRFEKMFTREKMIHDCVDIYKKVLNL